MSSAGQKHDEGKDPYALVPWGAMRAVVKVLQFGAARYGIHNWTLVEGRRDRYFSAAMRHLVAWQTGEDVDPDSNLEHLAHAAASILF